MTLNVHTKFVCWLPKGATYRVSDRPGSGDPPDSICMLRATTGWTREGVQYQIYYSLKRRQ